MLYTFFGQNFDKLKDTDVTGNKVIRRYDINVIRPYRYMDQEKPNGSAAAIPFSLTLNSLFQEGIDSLKQIIDPE